MSALGRLGGRLYSGDLSFNIVGRSKIWYAVSAVVVLISIGAVLLQGMNFSIDFRGGVEYQATVSADRRPAETQVQNVREAVQDTGVLGSSVPQVTASGDRRVGVQVPELSTEDSTIVRDAIAETVGASPADVDFTSIGPSWGSQITQKGILALVIFLSLVVIVIWAYFREWRMSVAALVALVHDLVVTIGVYALIGFEVTPGTIIGVLTIMGYSLYDTVVVFDKVRENTNQLVATNTMTYSGAANRAVNQVMVRSLNTSLSTLLPIAGILFVGAGMLGAGTLKDLALALLIGVLAGTYSSIFIATPVLAGLKEQQPQMRALRARVARRERQREASDADGEAYAVTVGAGQDSGQAPDATDRQGDRRTPVTVVPSTADSPSGPRRQPQRQPRSTRSSGSKAGRRPKKGRKK